MVSRIGCSGSPANAIRRFAIISRRRHLVRGLGNSAAATPSSGLQLVRMGWQRRTTINHCAGPPAQHHVKAAARPRTSARICPGRGAERGSNLSGYRIDMTSRHCVSGYGHLASGRKPTLSKHSGTTEPCIQRYERRLSAGVAQVEGADASHSADNPGSMSSEQPGCGKEPCCLI